MKNARNVVVKLSTQRQDGQPDKKYSFGKAVAGGNDFVYKNRPTVRIMTGLFLILLSYVIGWPAIGALGVISLSMGKPTLLIIGGPIVYGFSHLVFLIGMYLAGKEYAASCWKWIKNSLKEIK